MEGKPLDKIVLALFFLLMLVPSPAAQVWGWGNLDYSELRAEAYVNGVKFCNNNPQGVDCQARWDACDEARGVVVGGAYYALVRTVDVYHSGQYNYRVDDYYYAPGSDLGGSGASNGGRDYVGSGSGYERCDVWSLSQSSPSGRWWHKFRVSDALDHSSDNSLYRDVYAGCSAGCPDSYSCLAGKCVLPPDLTVTDLQVSPEQPTAGLNTALVAFIQNAGTGALTQYSPQIVTGVYSDGGFVGNVLQTGLAAGATVTQSVYSAFTAGTHLVRAVVDSGDAITESNEGNNERSETFSWRSSQPDIVVKSVSFEPAVLTAGQNFSLTALVGTSDGRELAQTSSRIDVFADGQLLASATAYAFYGQGASATWRGLALPTGTRTVRVVADANNNVAESNEDNNEYASTVNWAPPAGVALTVTGLAQAYYVGDAVSATVTVKDSVGNPLENAVVGFSDSLGNKYARATGSDGRALYSATASKSGQQTLSVSATKTGYATARTTRQYAVTDYNSLLSIGVHSSSGEPVQGAKIYANNMLRATTNAAGLAEMRVERGENNITITCKTGAICSTRTTYVEDFYHVNALCDCNLSFLVVNAKLQDAGTYAAYNGKPVAFLHVIENGELLGYTGFDGRLRVERMTPGNHHLVLAGCYNDSQSECQLNTTTSVKVSLAPGANYLTTYIRNESFRPTGAIILQELNGSSVEIRPVIAPLVVGAAILISQAIVVLMPSIGAEVQTKIIESDSKEITECQNANQGQLSACSPQVAMLALNFIPFVEVGADAAKTSKIVIKASAATKTIKALGIEAKIANAVKTAEEATHIKWVSRVGTEAVEESATVSKTGEVIQKITRNAVGLVSAAAAKIQPASKLTEATTEGLKIGGKWYTKTEIIQKAGTTDFGNIKGALGELGWSQMFEKLKQVYSNVKIVRYELDETKTIGKYTFRKTPKGTIAFDHPELGGEFDDIFYENGRLIVVQVKSGSLSGAAEQLERSVKAAKVLTGENAETLLVSSAGDLNKAKAIVKETNGRAITLADSTSEINDAVKKLIGIEG